MFINSLLDKNQKLKISKERLDKEFKKMLLKGLDNEVFVEDDKVYFLFNESGNDSFNYNNTKKNNIKLFVLNIDDLLCGLYDEGGGINCKIYTYSDTHDIYYYTNMKDVQLSHLFTIVTNIGNRQRIYEKLIKEIIKQTKQI